MADETTAQETNVTADGADESVSGTSETADGAGVSAEGADEAARTADGADETAEGADGGAAGDAGETAGDGDGAAAEAGEGGDGEAGDAQPTGETEKPGDASAGAKPGAPGARVAVIVLAAATVLLGGFGAWATIAAHSLRSNAAPPNLALTDGAATSAVSRQITSAINTVFSYNYANTAATRQAAQSLLTGPAIRQYDTYFALVTKDAPAQKLVVTTRVTNSGVELLNGDRARLLVFANQQDTRAGTRQTSYAGALFAVTAVHQGNRWKIENIDTFSGR